MMMQANENETDESFARRLAASEMGNFLTMRTDSGDAHPLLGSARQGGGNANYNGNQNNNTPNNMNGNDHENAIALLRQMHAQQHQQNGGGLNAIQGGPHNAENFAQVNQQQQRMNEFYHRRLELCSVITINLPQIIAAIIILLQDWPGTEASYCNQDHVSHWEIWCTVATIRMFIFSILVIITVFFKEWLDDNPLQKERCTNIKNMLDGLGLVWFVVGNMWIFGDDENSVSECPHPGRSPLYRLASVMLIINYVQICLPCILAVIMVPIFCFCMPCLIRLVARLHGGTIG